MPTYKLLVTWLTKVERQFIWRQIPDQLLCIMLHSMVIWVSFNLRYFTWGYLNSRKNSFLFQCLFVFIEHFSAILLWYMIVLWWRMSKHYSNFFSVLTCDIISIILHTCAGPVFSLVRIRSLNKNLTEVPQHVYFLMTIFLVNLHKPVFLGFHTGLMAHITEATDKILTNRLLYAT